MAVSSDGHLGLDGAAHAGQVVGQVGRDEVGLHRGHPAANVDADGGRAHRDPVDPRQPRHPAQLVEGGGLDGGLLCPQQRGCGSSRQ